MTDGRWTRTGGALLVVTVAAALIGARGGAHPVPDGGTADGVAPVRAVMAAPVVAAGVSADSFRRVLTGVAEAWNAGDARRAVARFTDDATYSQPPDRQLRRGRAQLFDYFGGTKGRPGEMRMTWHHLAFDSTTQVGFGEFSFTYGTTAHGVAVVRLRDGRIANWREYWVESPLDWRGFTRQNPF
ncbi:MAG: nuclear transport factor 2 family protein [Gemmatimonadaceae bacterium]|nr:nuclear transport factor 2 family protein [Gemmatimonadaceae bacterium]